MSLLTLTRLVNRKLIRISGPDCYPYLQSLFSNDLRYLYEPDKLPRRKHACVSPNVISTFMLNAQGRVICDLLVYRTPNTRFECSFTPPGESKEPDELLIECDESIATSLASTLYGYRVRRNVTLELAKDLNVWCLYPKLDTYELTDPAGLLAVQKLNTTVLVNDIIENSFTVVNDPRLYLMGLRILAHTSQDYPEVINNIKMKFELTGVDKSSIKRYSRHKYRIGIGEGSLDHPEGNCLPLECNADLLGSVSFDKGCYLGQELTARIHFTGVIRKRLMPVIFSIDKSQLPPDLPFAPGSNILDTTTNKKVGVVRNLINGRGLSLLRHDLISDTSKLIHEVTKVPVTTWRPHWWDSAIKSEGVDP